MKMYSRTLKKEVELETYDVETECGVKTIIKHGSLVDLLDSIEGIQYTLIKYTDTSEYASYGCKMQYGDFSVLADGESKEKYENSSIAKQYTSTNARRRALDRAFIRLLRLPLGNGNLYSSSEGITGKVKRKTENVMSEKAKTVADARSEETKHVIDTEEKDTEFVMEAETVEDELAEAADIPEDLPLSVEESKNTADKTEAVKEIEKDAKTSGEISFEEAKDHIIGFNCQQKGKTLQEIADNGKIRFIKQVVRYYPTNPDMQEDGPYFEAFLKGYQAS